MRFLAPTSNLQDHPSCSNYNRNVPVPIVTTVGCLLDTGGFVFRSPARTRQSLLLPELQPTLPRVRSGAVKWPGREADTSPSSIVDGKKIGANYPIPHTTSWRSQGQSFTVPGGINHRVQLPTLHYLFYMKSYKQTNKQTNTGPHYYVRLALRPHVSHGLLIHNVSRSHTTTHHRQ